MVLFPPARLGEAEVEHGYKGKGFTIHLIASEQGLPLGLKITSAKGDERKQVKTLIQEIEPLLPSHRIVFLEADKGCDSREFRVQLLMMGIYPLIPCRGKGQRGSRWIKRIR